MINKAYNKNKHFKLSGNKYQDNLEGISLLSIEISEKGKIGDVAVVQSVDETFEKQIIDIVKSLNFTLSRMMKRQTDKKYE